MRSALATLLIPTIMFSACGNDRSEPAPVVMTEPAAADALTILPVSGRCEATYEVVPIDFLPPPLNEFAAHGRVLSHGTCRITQLGRSEASGNDLFDFTIDPFAGRGRWVFTAANGDALEADAVIAIPQPGESSTITSSGSFSFVGGTGRFRDATGTAPFVGGGTVDGTSFFAFEGRLTLTH